MNLRTVMFRPFLILLMAVSSAAVQAKEWYEGGTLHQTTGAQWRIASADDKLATSADFAASLRKPRNMLELRANAAELEACISKAVSGRASDAMKVTSIAAMCANILGYGK